MYPTVIFRGAGTEYSDDIRIRLSASGLASLGYFMGLNKFFKQRNLLYLAASGICFGVIFLMGFRTMLAGLVLFSLILTVRFYGFSWKLFGYGLSVVFLFILILQVPVFEEKLELMIERNTTQNFFNPNYIRFITLRYFTGEHFHSWEEYILGSGYPSIESTYGKYMLSLRDSGIYYQDWGLIGLSWITGIVPVVIMIFYSIKSYRIRVPKEFYYLGTWFIYLVIVSFTTMEFYRPGNFVVQAIVLFSIDRVSKEFNTSSIYLNEL